MKATFLLGCILLAWLLCGCAHTHTRVMVRSWANDDYREQRAVEADDKPIQTYHMLSGEFEHGSVPREMLGPEDFRSISAQLRDALRKNGFRMVSIEEIPDLLIVVHWGMTTLDYEYITLDFGGDGFNDIEQPTDLSLRRNAIKLGTADLLSQSRVSAGKREKAYYETAEERFYFVCIAFDFEKLMQREKEVSWITQFSVPIRGIDHVNAVISMMRVAADYFGTHVTEVDFTRTEAGEESDVQVGRMQVVEDEANEETSESPSRSPEE